ncbi:hypothetical protein LCGC14_0286670 [marine sediment metagenome]|uniref:DUF4174 domain-containing protein n=2 Tax=root TaxID=1 RepID=A0A0F9TUH9_9ZZZZ
MMQSVYTNAQDLTDYTWKNRVLILYKNKSNIEEISSAVKEVKQNNIEFKERDLLVFIYEDGEFLNTSNKTINLRSPNTLPKSHEGYILIGKDGSIKLKELYPINLEHLFNRIDSMPMRKSEMKLNN